MAYLISGLIIREGGFRNSEQEGLITKSPVPKEGGGGGGDKREWLITKTDFQTGGLLVRGLNRACTVYECS